MYDRGEVRAGGGEGGGGVAAPDVGQAVGEGAADHDDQVEGGQHAEKLENGTSRTFEDLLSDSIYYINNDSLLN